jgi:Uncharacterized protein conserved in bacteria
MQLQPVYRVIVFVPPEALATLKQGIVAADPLVAGGYAEGMWESAPGQEQFRVLEGTQSAAGSAGERVTLPACAWSSACRAMTHGCRRCSRPSPRTIRGTARRSSSTAWPSPRPEAQSGLAGASPV